MHSNDFEAAFANFLDRHEYDEAENYLFSMIRLAFAAGWKAAGGAPPQQERIDCIRRLADGSEVPLSTSWVHSDYPDLAFADLGPDPVLPDATDTVLEVRLKP